MRQYTKNNISIWYDKENRKIGFQFREHDSTDFIEADNAIIVYAMLHNVIEDYFTDYPPKAGNL